MDNGMIFALAIVMSIILMGGTIYVWRITAPLQKASQELRAQQEADKTFDSAEQALKMHSQPHHEDRQAVTPAPKVHRSHYMDALRREQSNMSGEEVFKQLKKHNRKIR